MFTSIQTLLKVWKFESEQTAKLLGNITDESLSQRVAEGYRSLGELGWHLPVSLGTTASLVGLKIEAPDHGTTMPLDAAGMKREYVRAAESLARVIEKNWTDDTLKEVDDVYGEKWSKGTTMRVLMSHEIHHRGQLTVLMRQAGLPVPGLYGPSKDER